LPSPVSVQPNKVCASAEQCGKAIGESDRMAAMTFWFDRPEDRLVLRRTFLAFCFSCTSASALASADLLAIRHFAFKIKTKDGGIVGNVVIEASDVEAAKTKLMKRYPDCTILSVKEK
jgi:hypothetical protein